VYPLFLLPDVLLACKKISRDGTYEGARGSLV
jgi:hypothetical protein